MAKGQLKETEKASHTSEALLAPIVPSLFTSPTKSALSKYLSQTKTPTFEHNFQHYDRSRNLAIIVQYCGTNYHGYQRQANLASIQESLETCLSKICQEPILIYGCSRTDAGVHAKAFVANFYTNCQIPADRLPLALAGLLPKDISVLAAYQLGHEFNARFSNLAKTYSYQVVVAPVLPALLAPYAALEHGAYDLNLMREAAQILCGTHNFKAFCGSNTEVSDFVRTVLDIQIIATPLTPPAKGQLLTFKVTGTGFLYNMVRIIVGTLLAVGNKRLTLFDLQALFEKPDRKKAGKTMPPNGLCLEQVYYHEPCLRVLFDQEQVQN